MDKNDNVLLITYHPLTNVNGGTVMYQNLIESFPSKNLFWIGTGAFLQKTPDFIYNSTKSHRIIRSFIFSKNWIRIFSRFPFNIINTFLIYFIYTPRAILAIIYTIKKEKINYLWFETFRQTYLIAFVLIKLLNLKVHLSFNDHYSAHTKWPETPFLKFICKKLLSSDSSFDFISKGMLEYFKTNYNFKSKKYLLLWAGNSLKEGKKVLIRKEIKKIIFYGSIHGLDVFCSFCEYISNQNNIIMDMYSEFDHSFIANKYKNVYFIGQLTHEELNNKIIDYDLVYVPIYFDKKNKIVTQTSLSSKMILAINSGIPIFSHSPFNSANSIFVNEFNLGFQCSSMNYDDIFLAMEYLNNYENRIKISNSCNNFSSSNSKNYKKASELYNIILS
jgi:hypothetical protein